MLSLALLLSTKADLLSTPSAISTFEYLHPHPTHTLNAANTHHDGNESAYICVCGPSIGPETMSVRSKPHSLTPSSITLTSTAPPLPLDQHHTLSPPHSTKINNSFRPLRHTIKNRHPPIPTLQSASCPIFHRIRDRLIDHGSTKPSVLSRRRRCSNLHS